MSYKFGSPFKSPPPSIPLVQRSLNSPEHIRLSTSATTPKLYRARSRESLPKSFYLAKGGPVPLEQRRLTLNVSSPSMSHDNNVSLFSEVERLTLLNNELKRHNDKLVNELEANTFVDIRVPELEAIIRDLERQLAAARTKTDPAYREVREHNRVLLQQVDRLSKDLRLTKNEIGILNCQTEAADLLELKSMDLENRNQTLLNDRNEKERLISQYRMKIDELNLKINSLTFDNEQMQTQMQAQTIEVELNNKKVQEMEAEIECRIVEAKNQMESEKKALIEYEKAQLAGRHTVELRRKDEELFHLRKLIEDFENRLLSSAAEVENIRQVNLGKVEEADDLRNKISQLELQRQEFARQIEMSLRIELEQESTELRGQLLQLEAHYEGIIIQLRAEINDLQKLKGIIKQKDSQIEMLKIEFGEAEVAWERKLEESVESEAKSASNVFILERKSLEAEISINKDHMNQLEKQISLLRAEIDRLNNVQSQKVLEITELQRRLSSQEINHKMVLEDQRHRLENEKYQALDDLAIELDQINQDRLQEMRMQHIALEDKITRLVEENNRLALMVDEKVKDGEVYKQKMQISEESYKQQIQEIEKRLKLQHRLEIEKEINTRNMKHNAEIVTLESRISYLSADLESRENVCQEQAHELHEVKSIMKKRDVETQEERRRFTELERQLVGDISDIKGQFEHYKQVNLDSGMLQVRFEAEKASLNSQLMQQKEKVNELERRAHFLLEENEKTKETYDIKLFEIEQIKKSFRQREDKWQEEKGALESQLEQYKRNALDIKEMSIKLTSEKSHNENQVAQLKIINENTKKELEGVYELMAQRKKEYDLYVKQNDELKREVDRLSRQVRDNDSESSSKKDKYAGLERTIRDLEKERDLYKEQTQRLNGKLQQTHGELREKILEVDNSKQKYDDALTKMSAQLDTELTKKLMSSPSSSKSISGSYVILKDLKF